MGMAVYRTDCEAVRCLLPLVAAGGASEVDAEFVRRHVARCEGCGRAAGEAARLVTALEADATGLVQAVTTAAASRVAARLGERLSAAPRPGGSQAPASLAASARAAVGWPGTARAAARRLGRLGFALGAVASAGLYAGALWTVLGRLAGRTGAGWGWTVVGCGLAVAAMVVPPLLIPRRLAEEED